jgi:hypothetical protein
LLVAVVLAVTTILTSVGAPKVYNSNSAVLGSAGTFIPGSLTVQTANAAVAPTAKSFVIMITAKGFNDNATIVVNQGDKVSITFIMDQSQIGDTKPSNHHVITIDGYNINSEDLNPTHPTATVTFTASQLGTFFIYCDTEECPIHALMVSATIEVDPLVITSSSTSTTRSTSAQTTSSGSTTSTSTSSTQTTSSGSTTSTSTSTSTVSQGGGQTATSTIGGSSTTVTSSTSQSQAGSQGQAVVQTVTVTQTPGGSGVIDMNSLGSELFILLVISFLVGTLVTWRFVLPSVPPAG